MENYAVISKLRLIPIEGAKTLQLAMVEGLPYAVSKEYNENDLYIVFRPDGQLSKEYAEANSLIRTDENPKAYFGKNRKVRSINLMSGKIKSVGFVAELSSLEFTGGDISTLTEGTELSEFNGIPICSKFINEATRRRGANISTGKTASARELIGMPMHQDTANFRKTFEDVRPGDLVTVTLKLDGTSVRVGRPYIPLEEKWYHKLLNKFLPLQKLFTDKIVVGTRRTLLKSDDAKTYYDTNVYVEATRAFKDLLYPGETVYGEVVGWSSKDTPLFKRGNMVFKYNTAPGTVDFYVYAIRWTLPNGESIQLPWSKVKERCQYLGVKHVPEMMLPFVVSPYDNVDEILKTVELLAIGEDPIDNSHIREGVVIRIDRDGNTFFRKCKSVEFFLLEDASKNDESFVDVEEVQDIQ